MYLLNETIRIRRWQAYVLLGMTGFAMGMVLSQMARACGI